MRQSQFSFIEADLVATPSNELGKRKRNKRNSSLRFAVNVVSRFSICHRFSNFSTASNQVKLAHAATLGVHSNFRSAGGVTGDNKTA
jgi:hypothetical protein